MQDHHSRPVLARVLVDERQRGARRLLAEDRLRPSCEHGGELRRVVAPTQREEEVRDAPEPASPLSGRYLDAEANARRTPKPDRAWAKQRRRSARSSL